AGKVLNVKAERGDQTLDFSLSPKKMGEKGYFTIGVVPYGNKVLIGNVVEGDIAEKAGIRTMDEVTAVNGVPVAGTEAFVSTLRASSGKKLDLTIQRKGGPVQISVTPRLREVLTVENAVSPNAADLKTTLITDNMQVVKDGIKKGTVKFNGVKVASFEQFTALVSANKGKNVTLENAGGKYSGVLKYDATGFVGIEPAISPDLEFVSFGPVEGFVKALVDPYDFVVMNLKGIGMLIGGKLDVRENLSGPIRIAKIAGDTAYYRGISAFIILMAKISIILMVMNLLPIPAVDGSYVIFFTIEWIIRRPLNEKVMEKIQTAGFFFIILLSVFVIFNDLSFFPVFQKFFAIFGL
ncbi:MAG: site-2 protease family protein, partial [Spirochaetota bacterium]